MLPSVLDPAPADGDGTDGVGVAKPFAVIRDGIEAELRANRPISVTLAGEARRHERSSVSVEDLAGPRAASPGSASSHRTRRFIRIGPGCEGRADAASRGRGARETRAQVNAVVKAFAKAAHPL